MVRGVICTRNRPLRGSEENLSGGTRLTPRPNVHGLPLADQRRINVVTTTIVACAVPGDISNGTGCCCQSCTLMTVHPVTATTHSVDVITRVAPGPRNAPNLALLWRIVVKMVMELGVVHLAPTVPVFSKGTNMVDQGRW